MVFDRIGKIFGKGARAIGGDVEVIKWPAHLNPQTYIAWRYPKTDIRLGSVLIVNEAQKALFFRDGKLMGIIDAGRHVLDTQNVPFLHGFVTGLYEESIFKADIVFINLLRYQDAISGRVFIDWIGVHLLYKATLYYTIDENNLETFYLRVMGLKSQISVDDIRKTLVPFIDATLRDALAEYSSIQAQQGRTLQNVSDFLAMLNEFSDYIKASISEKITSMFGITISDLLLNLDISDEDKRILQMSGPRAFAAMYEREWAGREKISKNLAEGGGSSSTAGAVAPFIMMPWMMYPPAQPPTQQQQQMTPPVRQQPYPYPPYPTQQQTQQSQTRPSLQCPYCEKPIPFLSPVCPYCARRIKWCPDGRPVKEEDQC